MAFCPICGDDAVDVFCESCLREREPLLVEIKPLTLIICPSTDEIKVSGRWVPIKQFHRFVKKHLVFNKKAQIVDLSYPLPVFDQKPTDFTLPILVAGTVSKHLEPYEEEYEIDVPVQIEESEKANLSKSGYFEGTLQLRKPRDEVVSAIEELVNASDDAFIAKAIDVKGGIDFEITNQDFLVSLVYELRKRFGGTIRKNAKLHTYDHQRSKKVYRLTCLLRLPKFWVGDVIQTRKRLMRITSMGQVLKGWDLARRKYTAMECPSDDEVSVHEVFETVLSSTRPKAMILDPYTFQEIPLAHQTPALPGTTLRIIEDDSGRWFGVDMLSEEREAIKARKNKKES